MKAHNVTAADYLKGPLEDWTEGALSFNGRDQYAVVPDAQMRTASGRSRARNLDMDTNSFLIENRVPHQTRRHRRRAGFQTRWRRLRARDRLRRTRPRAPSGRRWQNGVADHARARQRRQMAAPAGRSRPHRARRHPHLHRRATRRLLRDRRDARRPAPH